MNTEFADEHLNRLATTGNSKNPELVRREVEAAKNHFRLTRDEMKYLIERGKVRGLLVDSKRQIPGNQWRSGGR